MYQLSYVVKEHPGTTYPTLLQASCAAAGAELRLIDNLYQHCCCYFDGIDEVIGDLLRHRFGIKQYNLYASWDGMAEHLERVFNCCEQVIDWIINSLTKFYLRDVECLDYLAGENPRTEYLFEGTDDLSTWYKLVAQK